MIAFESEQDQTGFTWRIMEGGIAIRAGEAGVMSCALQGIELARKIDWGEAETL